jgi:YVTN family beta-propeller protein
LQEVAISNDGAYAFLAAKDSNKVLIYDVATRTEVDSVDVADPHAVATGPDRNTVYVMSRGMNRVVKIKQGRFHVDDQGVVANPRGLASHPQGNALYYLQNRDSTNGTPGVVWLLDPVTLEASNTMTLPTGVPTDLTTSPDGTQLYVTLSGWVGSTLYGLDRLVIMDTATFSMTEVLSFSRDGFIRVAAHPNGEKVYVTARGGGGKLYIFDVISPTVAPKILNVGSGPIGLGITPDGSRVYVANRTSANLSVIETVSDTVTTTVALPIEPSGSATSVAITPDGKKAYVSYSSYNDGTWKAQYRAVVVDVDPASPTYHATSVITTTGARLNQFAIIAEGAYAVVASQDTDELIFIDTATDTEVQRAYTGDGPNYVTAWVEPNVAYVANEDGSIVRIARAKARIYLPLVLRQK